MQNPGLVWMKEYLVSFLVHGLDEGIPGKFLVHGLDEGIPGKFPGSWFG